MRKSLDACFICRRVLSNVWNSRPSTSSYHARARIRTPEDIANAVSDLKSGLSGGERASLASSITLVESTNVLKRKAGDQLLKELLADARLKFANQGAESLIYRIGILVLHVSNPSGISGAPGVGKSTFIEALGSTLIHEYGKRVAVLTVDPSSHQSGGSLLGDLTRMPELARNPQSFVRSSPSSGSLGGVCRGTQEAIILCEAAGYDVVLVETVGVGQSETLVADMVDVFTLLISPGQGDELQGVKRGVMELADIVAVTKADGDLESQARIAQGDYISALKYFRPRSPNWRPEVLRISSKTGAGLPELWETLLRYRNVKTKSEEIVANRKRQLRHWMWRHIQDEMMREMRLHPAVIEIVGKMEDEVESGKKTPGQAAEYLLGTFLNRPIRE